MNNNSFRGARKPSGRSHFGGSRPRYNNFNRSKNNRSSAGIDPKRFINKPTTPVETEAVFVPEHQFADFPLHDNLKRNILQRGYKTPTPIQDAIIMPILEGRDVIGLANTGTGKTAAFLIPTLNRLLDMPESESALIVAPTRELAQQIDDQFRSLVKGLRIFSALCVGGMSINKQIGALQRYTAPRVIIGTPGRLKDLVQRRILKLSHSSIVILDEADQMLDMGFINDIRFLMQQLPQERQSQCFSATITPEIQRLLDDLLTNPVSVSVRTGETSEHVEQDVIHAETKERKIEVLKELLTTPDFDKVLIFGETKWGVQRLAEQLTHAGIPSEAIHGNKSQPQRQRALQAFKANRVRVLVATDVAARGLDIPHVSHVINFDQPKTYETYVHRIGRTGRAGRHGKALTFVPTPIRH